MPNHPRLLASLNWAEQHPEQHNQLSWRCETGMCFAGITATLAGAQWYAESSDVTRAYLVHVDGRPMHVSVFARDYLELDHRQADELFHWSNTLDDIRKIIRQWAPDTTPAELAALRADLDENLPLYVERRMAIPY